MNQDQAQSAVAISAFLVAAIFGYRKLTEATGASTTSVESTGHFVVGWGFTFITLSIIAQAAPAVGGMGAALVAVGDLLGQGKPLVTDITGALSRTKTATSTSSTPNIPATAQQLDIATRAAEGG